MEQSDPLKTAIDVEKYNKYMSARALLDEMGYIVITRREYQDLISRAAAALGSARSEKKTSAVRENGKKGGRPRKSA